MTQETYDRACILYEYIEDAQRMMRQLEDKQVKELKLRGGDSIYTSSILLGVDLVQIIKSGLEQLIKTRQQEFDSL